MPLLSEAQNFATQISFGDNIRLVPRFDRADVILALDAISLIAEMAMSPPSAPSPRGVA